MQDRGDGRKGKGVIIFRRKVTVAELVNDYALWTEGEIKRVFFEDKDYALLLFALAAKEDAQELGEYRPKYKVRKTSVCKAARITLRQLKEMKGHITDR